MVLQKPLLSVEEFEAFVRRPENKDREFELVGGEIIEVVSNPLSSKIGARISGFLFVYLAQNDIGHLTGADGGYIVSGERYIPDVAFISYEKQPALEYHEGYNPAAPDLAVEVLSPGNDDESMRIKIANYLAAGTIVWAFNVEETSVEVYVPGKPVQIIGSDGALDGGDILPGFKLSLRDIFQTPESSS